MAPSYLILRASNITTARAPHIETNGVLDVFLPGTCASGQVSLQPANCTFFWNPSGAYMPSSVLTGHFGGVRKRIEKSTDQCEEKSRDECSVGHVDRA